MSSSEPQEQPSSTTDADPPRPLSMYQSLRIGLALIFYRTPGTIRRPASHKWLIALCCLFTLPLVKVLGGMMGQPDKLHFLLNQAATLFVMFMSPFILLVMLVGGRRKWAYYLVSAGLTVLTLRGLQTLLMVRLFGAPKSVGVDTLIMGELMVGGMVYLWWRVVLGEPSRKYFGMIEDTGDRGGNPIPPEDETFAVGQELPVRDSDESR
ncbi:hypothetical protein [Roseimicrobium sp. ORNL1]|uniref:hypothetical protein n=1 Tax=Roseimicrobium sp. ORNL1 TaxID=2711231 RepID=UPI0013E1D7B9|nr:hypothetical protein [Roseimicrobium sp. ORNL1]QIF03470.1 hypothetical protein G5S37_18705 [Roseimicrobium sp. ORNL1]